MWRKTDRAFDVMRERNRRYLEEQKKNEEDPAGQNGAPETAETESGEALSDAEELRRAEEKLRAYQEQNGGEGGVYRMEDPTDASGSDTPTDDDLSEARRKAEEFHEENDSVQLEKGDIPAMIISAILVFGPIFLVFLGLILMAWFFLQ